MSGGSEGSYLYQRQDGSIARADGAQPWPPTYGLAVPLRYNIGTQPPFGVNLNGKELTVVTQPAAGAGPFTGGNTPNIQVQVTGLGTLAQNVSAPITVTNSQITTGSRVWPVVTNYAIGAAGAMAAGCPVVVFPNSNKTAGTSFTFQIANVGTGALSGTIVIDFKIEN